MLFTASLERADWARGNGRLARGGSGRSAHQTGQLALNLVGRLDHSKACHGLWRVEVPVVVRKADEIPDLGVTEPSPPQGGSGELRWNAGSQERPDVRLRS